MVRNGVVGQAEHDAVERDRRPILGRITLGQLDIAPVIAGAKLVRLGKHAGRKVHAIDPAVWSDRPAQEGKVPPRSATDLKDTVTRPQLQAIGGPAAEPGWLEEQIVEQRYKA